MSIATLAGRPVMRALVTLPSWGEWYADATIDQELQLEGRVELVVADLKLEGTVVSGGPSHGTSHYRIAAGGASWGKRIPPKSYANDAGVKVSTLVEDAALACGESVDITTIPARTVGSAFVRVAAPAARVLQLVAGEAWYVGEDGVTRLGRRATSTFTGLAPRTNVDLARGTITLAAQSVAQLVPGVVVDGLEAVDVRHELSETGLRTTLWGTSATSPSTSRRLAAERRKLEQLFPALRYSGHYEYRVVTREQNRLNLQPVRVSLGLPDLRRVPVRSAAGARADVALGARVLVVFVDNDPARPAVVAFEDPDGPGYLPDQLYLGKGQGRVLREGDLLTLTGVQAGAGVAGVTATVTSPDPSRVFA